MPNCPKCGAEVDVGQKMCAWCGVELSGGAPQAPATPPTSRAPTPARAQPPPSSHGPTVEDARSLAKAGDLEGALTVFRAVVESSPQDQEALFGIGGVYFKKGDPRRAAEAWLKLKTLNPAYPNIDGWLAQVQTRPSSSPHIPSPEPTPYPAPSPPRPARREASREPGEEDDWRRQAVRVDRTDAPPVPKPEPKPVPAPESAAADDVSRWMGGKLPGWVVPVGWVLIALYLLIIFAIYL